MRDSEPIRESSLGTAGVVRTPAAPKAASAQAPGDPSLNPSLRYSHALPCLILAALAFILNGYYLTAGLQGEDFIFLNFFRDDPLPYERWRGPWTVTDLDCFNHMWWFSGTLPEGGFWRPIPGLIWEALVRVFGERAFPMHLLMLILHAGVTVSLYRLVFRLMHHRSLAFLCALFFVICEDHSMGLGWTSTFTDLICVQAILVALLAWTSWLRRRKPWPLILGLLALAVALGSKESAAMAPLTLALLGILMPEGKANLIERGTLRLHLQRAIARVGGWLPPLLILVAYLAGYKFLALGGINSLVYIDPLSDPGRFLGHLAAHLPVMFLATLSPIPPSTYFFWAELLVPMAITGLIAAALAAAALIPFRHHPLSIWAALIYLASLLPQMGTDASERLLYFPTLFAAILLAQLAASARPLARRLYAAAPQLPRMTRAGGWWVVIAVLLPGILLSAVYPFMFLPSGERSVDDLCSVLPHLEGNDDPVIFLLNARNPFVLLYGNDVLSWYRNRPTEVWMLAACNACVSFERVGETSFVIRADRGGWLSNMFASIVRTESTLAEGRVYEQGLFTATLLKLTRSRTDALAVRFDMKQPLDDRGTAFFRWNGSSYEPIDLTALAIGETTELADTSNIWENM